MILTNCQHPTWIAPIPVYTIAADSRLSATDTATALSALDESFRFWLDEGEDIYEGA